MKKLCFLLFIFIVHVHAQEGHLIRNPIRNIPKWVRSEFSNQYLEQRYTIIYNLYPYYLTGDFNGDRKKDVVIQLQDNNSGKFGIGIFHRKKRQALQTQVFILGAGNALKNIGDDLKWVNIWDIVHRKHASDGIEQNKIPTIEGDAISIGKSDSTSGLIYWDGKKYSWYKMKNLK